MNPKITVGLPVYNAGGTVAAAIGSVLRQTFADWELLLVDDGSTDGSRQILEGIDDPRVRVVCDGVNRGLVFRLNQIIALARAPYLARMDADDLMHPERLARQLDYLTRHPETDICGSAAYVIDQHGIIYGVRGDGERYRSADIRVGFIHPTVTGKTEWFRRNTYRAAFPRAEDLELWQRADSRTICGRLPDALLFYREPLTPQLSKYRQSCRTERKILFRYGPESMGPVRTTIAVAGVWTKELIYLGCAAAGLAPWLIAKRNRPCTPEEHNDAGRILAEIIGPEPDLSDARSAARGYYSRSNTLPPEATA